MIEQLIQFSLDLYDIESGATLSVESDHLIISLGSKRQIIIWIVDGNIYPEITHGFEEAEAVELEVVKKVLDLVGKYN